MLHLVGREDLRRKTFDEDASPTEISPCPAARATSQLSSSLTRNTAVAWPISRTTSGRSTTPALVAQSATRSRSPSIRPAGPSITRSWLSWVVISFQPWFSSPTSMSTGTRTSW